MLKNQGVGHIDKIFFISRHPHEHRKHRQLIKLRTFKCDDYTFTSTLTHTHLHNTSLRPVFSLNNEEKSTVEILYSIHQMNKKKIQKNLKKSIRNSRDS